MEDCSHSVAEQMETGFGLLASLPFLCLCRLLGAVDLQLRDAIQKGRSTVNSLLRSSKGEMTKVCVCV